MALKKDARQADELEILSVVDLAALSVVLKAFHWVPMKVIEKVLLLAASTGEMTDSMMASSWVALMVANSALYLVLRVVEELDKQ